MQLSAMAGNEAMAGVNIKGGICSMKNKWSGLALATLAAAVMAAPTASVFAAEAAEEVTLPYAEIDEANKENPAAPEEYPATEFEWYKWNFEMDPELDYVGTANDGVGTLYFRLFTPAAEDGVKYPVVLNLGGLGSTNSNVKNGYASRGVYFASDVNQAENPCYVLTMNMPFEACVSMEAENAYIYQIGEFVKWMDAEFGNVDMDRIYSTGRSQGAGWTWELAAVQPDLLAAALLNAGTTVHTTWGDQCDLEAIAKSDVNIYIWHGFNDIYIPVNEAYRAYNTLTALGKTNIVLDIDDAIALGNKSGHTNPVMYAEDGLTKWTEWMFAQVKGTPCEGAVEEEGEYADYTWAGVLALSGIEGWTTAHDYATWVEPAENTAWDQLKTQVPFAEGEGGTGKTWLAKIRIGDETSTQYDQAARTIHAGDTVAVTIQGYMGVFGDDWDAFNEEWDVDWAVMEGSVTNIELTCEASEEMIIRPASVTLANGGGPNVNNSLFSVNALDGHQTYVKIQTAENFEGETLKVALRFTRDLGDGEYASYYHVLEMTVE